MKTRSVLIIIFAVLAVSCKKSYTCECVSTAGGTVTGYASTTIHDTHKKAKAECESGTGSSTVGSYTTAVSCELK